MVPPPRFEFFSLDAPRPRRRRSFEAWRFFFALAFFPLCFAFTLDFLRDSKTPPLLLFAFLRSRIPAAMAVRRIDARAVSRAGARGSRAAEAVEAGRKGGGDGACLSLSSFLCDQERARQAASPPPPPFRPLLPAPVFHLLLGRGGTRVFPVLPDATSEKGQEQQGQGQSDDEGDITKRRRRRRRPPPMVSRSSLFSLVLSLLLWLPLELLLGAFGEKMTSSFLEQQPRRVPRSGREPPPRDVTRLPSRFD
jgi:hypothetical protein